LGSNVVEINLTIGAHLSNLLPNLRGRGGKELEEGKLGPGSTSTTS
jgi:hypothetical protein